VGNIWTTNASGTNAVMQEDGNFVLYTASGQPVWASGTNGNSGAYAALQADGNVVVYSASGAPLRASGTNGK
jgi:hypothetical protein